MTTDFRHGSSAFSFFIIFFFLCNFLFLSHHSHAQNPDTDGYTCTPNRTIFPCRSYVFYRASAPNFLDLAAIADLFWLSRLEISRPSNISDSNSTFPLVSGQPLLIPVTCSCNSVNSSVSISYANLSYKINSGDTFYLLSTIKFQNLTTFQSVEAVNPALVPTNLSVGADVNFPIFCKCPNPTHSANRVEFLVSYVVQPSDNASSIALTFGVEPNSITAFNGNNLRPFSTIFIPVNRLPNLTQPIVVSPPPESPAPASAEKQGVITGLGIGLGVSGFLLLAACVLLVAGTISRWKNDEMDGDSSEKLQEIGLWKGNRIGKEMEANLMADVSDCLDKYRVFKIEELIEATDGFSDRSLIQGTVYKGKIGGTVFAIKKMKWNAYEELKILQKVNHGNLVKLEGFCIDADDASCYLIYEFVENGALSSWLHGGLSERRRLNWKTRLRIAIDVANGLLYIHEHTRPRVVHKDIKSSNILLDANMRGKIANFGLAKSGCNAITMHIVGTQGYIAPEYIADGVVSTKMDVFSFGVVLLELVSGREAVDEEGRVLWAEAGGFREGAAPETAERLRGWIDGVLYEQSCSVESVTEVMSVAATCLQKDPTKRPSMVEIVYALSKSEDVVFDISDDALSAPPLMAR